MAALDPSDDENEGIIATINIIPFVDIVLVLLVIFMLTSNTIVRASLAVALPKAASGGSAVESTLNIVLTDAGDLLLNGETATETTLAAYVRGEVVKNPKLQAVISADKHLDYGAVVHIIDLIKQNGLSAFALNIERDAPTQP